MATYSVEPQQANRNLVQGTSSTAGEGASAFGRPHQLLKGLTCRRFQIGSLWPNGNHMKCAIAEGRH